MYYNFININIFGRTKKEIISISTIQYQINGKLPFVDETLMKILIIQIDPEEHLNNFEKLKTM